ncbi:hypothetical protein Zmor_003887 [Zophobas morio]|uniref:Uncharacterized protein n=1 Tax=Zophobas morio TaxID=2755281 RepID=A0AA38M0H8_9CUCU|nr:hypothetical protein Zmor_003887 [Zophobas morio]
MNNNYTNGGTVRNLQILTKGEFIDGTEVRNSIPKFSNDKEDKPSSYSMVIAEVNSFCKNETSPTNKQVDTTPAYNICNTSDIEYSSDKNPYNDKESSNESTKKPKISKKSINNYENTLSYSKNNNFRKVLSNVVFSYNPVNDFIKYNKPQASNKQELSTKSFEETDFDRERVQYTFNINEYDILKRWHEENIEKENRRRSEKIQANCFYNGWNLNLNSDIYDNIYNYENKKKINLLAHLPRSYSSPEIVITMHYLFST